MSIVPIRSLEESFMDMELSKWDIGMHYIQRNGGVDLIGKAFDDLEQMIEAMPSDERHNINVQLSHSVGDKSGYLFGIYKGFKVYKSTFIISTRDREHPIAYGCNNCEKLIIGPPETEVLSKGAMGVRYICNNCHTYMYDQVFGHRN